MAPRCCGRCGEEEQSGICTCGIWIAPNPMFALSLTMGRLSEVSFLAPEIPRWFWMDLGYGVKGKEEKCTGLGLLLCCLQNRKPPGMSLSVLQENAE